ncbi:MAG: hypothetical protein F7C33_04360 [Desulfurococcales archaeon]|nr:hypothetical protein [Desulfurococcales archaeon]
MKKRAISPAISEFILAVITVSLAILATSYFIGVWNQQQEKFSVVPIVNIRSTLNSTSTQPVLVLHIKNEGARAVHIIRVEIRVGTGAWVNTSNWTIKPGESVDLTISSWEWWGNDSPPDLNPGDKCRVVIITEKIGSLFYDVTVS